MAFIAKISVLPVKFALLAAFLLFSGGAQIVLRFLNTGASEAGGRSLVWRLAQSWTQQHLGAAQAALHTEGGSHTPQKLHQKVAVLGNRRFVKVPRIREAGEEMWSTARRKMEHMPQLEAYQLVSGLSTAEVSNAY